MDRYTFFDAPVEPAEVWRGMPVMARVREDAPARRAVAAACSGGLHPGTRLMTDRGDVPVEGLQPGDRMLTRDNGFQPVLWAGRLEAAKAAGAVHLPADPSGLGHPSESLTLSGDHRVLLASPLAEAMFFAHEVLVPARCLGAARPVAAMQAKAMGGALHVLFAQHQIVLAQGLWIESLLAGPEEMCALPPALAADMAACPGQSARLCLNDAEARMLVHMMDAESARSAATAGRSVM